MKIKLRKNILKEFKSDLTKSVCWIIIFSIILVTISIVKSEQNPSIGDSDKTVLFTTLNQGLSEINFSERSSRVKNFEKQNYSVEDISSHLVKIDDYFNQSKIRNVFSSLNLLLTSSPNNHSFRGPPSIS